MPSRAASNEELVELSSCLKDHPGTLLEFIPTAGPFDDTHKQLMTDMSLAAEPCLNWNLLIVNRGSKEIYQQQLTACDYAAARKLKR
ncbi:hypothetical protein A9Q89_12365 [Gammaproteobacteria bacterium 53_120_T64]|nr:hypothetical protein A9Q89_12365 [Gammaproteobacteria bacterium 53_120_T64]